MPPFDIVALVATLNAFYPPASVANLQRAFAERLELFGGGVLSGSKGEKLRLPNGQVWDLIFAAGDPTVSRYQILEVTGEPGAPIGIPLEPGPLVRIDLDAIPRPVVRHDFETLVAEHYRQLAGVDQALASGAAALAAADGSAALRASFEEHVASAAREVDGQLATDFEVDITPELEAIRGHGHLIDVRESEVEDPDAAPPELADVDPGEPPPEEPEPPQED